MIGYIAAFNPDAVASMRVRIEESVLPLSGYPYIFKAGRVPGTREVVVHPNYIVVYESWWNALKLPPFCMRDSNIRKVVTVLDGANR